MSDLTGGAGAGVDTRVDIVCDPNLSRGDRSWNRAFATECVDAAVGGDQPHRHGDERRDHRPGISQLGHLARQGGAVRRDAAVPVPRRAVQRVQQRAVLDGQHDGDVQRGGRADESEFGFYTAARPSRRMQLTARVEF